MKLIKRVRVLFVAASLIISMESALKAQSLPIHTSMQQLIASSQQDVTLKANLTISLADIISKSRKVLKEELRINGHPNSPNGYLEVTLYAPTDFAYYLEPIAKLRLDATGATYPEIHGNAGNELKANIQSAKVYGVYCEELESGYWPYLTVAAGAVEMLAGGGLFLGAVVLTVATDGVALPLAAIMGKAAIVLEVTGATTLAGGIAWGADHHFYNQHIRENLSNYKGRFEVGNSVCELPNPSGDIVIEIKGKSFTLNAIHLPGFGDVLPANFALTKSVSLSMATTDGMRLTYYPWEAVPSTLGLDGLTMPMYVVPNEASRVLPELLLGPENHVPGQVTVTFPPEGHFMILASPDVFNTSTLNFQPHESLGPLLVNVKSAQEASLTADQIITFDGYKVFGTPGATATFDVGPGGPYIFTDDSYTSSIAYNESQIRSQGKNLQEKVLDYNLSLGNNHINVGDELESTLVNKKVFDLKSGSTTSELTLIRPNISNASLYMIVKHDDVGSVCNKVENVWGDGACSNLGRAFVVDNTVNSVTYAVDYDLVRIKGAPDQHSAQQYVHFTVTNDGPYLVSNNFKEFTNAETFYIAGENVEYTTDSESALSPSQWLSDTDDAYKIISMTDGFYNYPAALPTSFVRLSTEYGKVYSEDTDFHVVSLPANMPTDWSYTDLGTFFHAKRDGDEHAVGFHLYKVQNAKGKLFGVKAGGPFLVGPDGALTLKETELKHVGVH